MPKKHVTILPPGFTKVVLSKTDEEFYREQARRRNPVSLGYEPLRYEEVYGEPRTEEFNEIALRRALANIDRERATVRALRKRPSTGGTNSGVARRLTMDERRDEVCKIASGSDEQFRTSQEKWAHDVFDSWVDGDPSEISTIKTDISALQAAGRLPRCVPKKRGKGKKQSKWYAR